MTIGYILLARMHARLLLEDVRKAFLRGIAYQPSSVTDAVDIR